MFPPLGRQFTHLNYIIFRFWYLILFCHKIITLLLEEGFQVRIFSLYLLWYFRLFIRQCVLSICLCQDPFQRSGCFDTQCSYVAIFDFFIDMCHLYIFLIIVLYNNILQFPYFHFLSIQFLGLLDFHHLLILAIIQHFHFWGAMMLIVLDQLLYLRYSGDMFLWDRLKQMFHIQNNLGTNQYDQYLSQNNQQQDQFQYIIISFVVILVVQFISQDPRQIMQFVTKTHNTQISSQKHSPCTKQQFNPKQIYSFCIKKQKDNILDTIKTNTSLSFKPESAGVKRFSMTTTGGMVNKPQQNLYGIQFKDTKDNKQKQRDSISYSFSKKNEKQKQDNKVFNRTQSPKYFASSQKSDTRLTMKNNQTQFKKQNQPKMKITTVNYKSQIKLLQAPKTPVKSTTKEETCSTIPTKSSSALQTAQKDEIPDTKSSIQIGFSNKTIIVNSLAKQLNQKEQKIAQLENRLTISKNQIQNLKAQHIREMTIKQRQKSDVIKQNDELKKVLKQANIKNKDLLSFQQIQRQQISKLNQDCLRLQSKLSQLIDKNQKLQFSLKKANEINEMSISQQIYEQIQKHLQAKGQRVIELQKYNQSILKQLQRIKQNIPSQICNPTIYSLPEEGNFNIFEQAFKTYISQTQKYKKIIEEKEKEKEDIKQKYGEMRVQNQRLRNQLKIQELRRVSDLRNNNTISSIQRQSIMNELRDAQRELSLSKEKTKALSTQIKNKDQFIMKNIIRAK